MITLRKARDRGISETDWLKSYHSFSFGMYRDPKHMGFGVLRVINDDIVAGGGGFHTHPHHDMEIITYVLSGVLQHKDSLGNGSAILPGDVQRMSAGTGILHSEFNGSETDPVHLLQIWILPDTKGVQPGYEQKHFMPEERQGKLRLVASKNGRDGSVRLHQDADMYAANLSAGGEITFRPRQGRKVWLHTARGTMSVNGNALEAGDGAAIESESSLVLRADGDAEFLLFDLP